jgi:hypothetical protein
MYTVKFLTQAVLYCTIMLKTEYLLKFVDSFIIAEEVDTNPWYIYECVPLLKNLAGFENGSKKNSILKAYFLLDTYNSFLNFLSFFRNASTSFHLSLKLQC